MGKQVGQPLAGDKWKEMLFFPFSFRSGRNKVRKLREVSKDPWVFIAHKRVLLVLFSFPFSDAD